MSKIEEYKTELLEVQEMAIVDTIALVKQANQCDKSQKTQRGDLVWLYKGANQTLAIAARIEQLLTAKQTNTDTTEEEEKRQEALAAKLLASAKKDLSKRKGTKQDGKEG